MFNNYNIQIEIGSENKSNVFYEASTIDKDFNSEGQNLLKKYIISVLQKTMKNNIDLNKGDRIEVEGVPFSYHSKDVRMLFDEITIAFRFVYLG